MDEIIIEPSDTALDGKEDIVLNFPKEELYVLMLEAHRRDITFNQLVEDILIETLDRIDRGDLLVKDLQDSSPEVY